MKRFSLTEDDMQESMFGESSEGICIACGSTQGGCEPDARKYRCEACGENTVFGFEQALLEGLVDITDGE